jgi:hypothetical protein
MESFRIRLDACDPTRRCWRAYRIEAGTDLLGDWLVDVTYGRIGSRGRTVRHVARDEADARRIVRHCLQRRATAPKRIGVAYQLRELDDPAQWIASSTAAADQCHSRHGEQDFHQQGEFLLRQPVNQLSACP